MGEQNGEKIKEVQATCLNKNDMGFYDRFRLIHGNGFFLLKNLTKMPLNDTLSDTLDNKKSATH